MTTATAAPARTRSITIGARAEYAGVPPRCRNPRPVHTVIDVDVDVPSPTSDDAPVVLQHVTARNLSTNEITAATEYRSWQHPDGIRRLYTRNDAAFEDSICLYSTITHLPHQASPPVTEYTPVLTADETRDLVTDTVRSRIADGELLIIDGQRWQATPEPVYRLTDTSGRCLVTVHPDPDADPRISTDYWRADEFDLVDAASRGRRDDVGRVLAGNTEPPSLIVQRPDLLTRPSRRLLDRAAAITARAAADRAHDLLQRLLTGTLTDADGAPMTRHSVRHLIDTEITTIANYRDRARAPRR